MLKLSGLWQRRADNEVRRLKAAEVVPKSVPKFTKEGFKKYQFDPVAFKMVRDWYLANKHLEETEQWDDGNSFTNHYEVATTMQHIPHDLKMKVVPYIRRQISEWSGVNDSELEFTSLYGIRYYKRGAVLRMHQDRDDQLVLSMIVNVDQDVDEPWMLEIMDHQDKLHHVPMEPGEIVYYESIACVHGRPEPLKGKYYANFFAHFRPRGWLNTVKEFREKNGIPDPKEGIAKRTMASPPPRPNPGGKQPVQTDLSKIGRIFEPEWGPRTKVVSRVPVIHALDNFLTSQECDAVLAACKDKYDSAGVCVLPASLSNPPFLSKIERRVARVAGVQMQDLEPLQVKRLSPGDVVLAGRDWLDAPNDISNQREISLRVYLNDDFQGGQTKGKHVTEWSSNPKKGTALYWHNCKREDESSPIVCFNEVYQEDAAPTSGTKYVLLIRTRFEQYRNYLQLPIPGVATAPFTPSRDAEAALSVGDRVTVHRYAPLGWIEVTNHNTAKRGWSPGGSIKEEDEDK